MAYIRQEEAREPRTITLAERVQSLESQSRLSKRDAETKEKVKQFNFPFKWRRKFSQAKRKKFSDMMLVIYFNKKNEIEPPRFMPIYDGNMVIWRNKPYEFDPRAIWRIKGVRGQPMVYCIKEIDRRPIKNPESGKYKRDKQGRIVYSVDAAISNNDVDEIRARGDSTESDEFLIKAALKAQQSQAKKSMNVAVLVVILVIVAGGLIWFFTSS